VGWRQTTPFRERLPRPTEELPITDYRLVVNGPLPAGVITEIGTRFAPTDIRSETNRVVIYTGATDQAALRALLSLIWDVGAELCSITQTSDAERTTTTTVERRTP
jgi:hypothetical protein